MIGIFNRSYYEDVLVSRVHPEIIVNEHVGEINDKKQVDDAFLNVVLTIFGTLKITCNTMAT